MTRKKAGGKVCPVIASPATAGRSTTLTAACAGTVPVTIEVLAPNQRPIQVTDDLSAFWRDMYLNVKAELSRRYPRHEWR